MRFSYLAVISFASSLVNSSPITTRQSTKAPFFILSGDSTTAVGGGWGDGFLDTLKAPASGINSGHSGATTASFRAGGDWQAVISQIITHKNDSDVYVTIQFGHNDQKEEANISLEQFSENLGAFVGEVRNAGGEPILVTSLTRRVFSGDPARIVQSLANERNATITVAEAKESKFIDLNKASEDFCNEIGPEASYQYNLVNATRQGDTTHLNAEGEKVFGRMVSDLLNDKYADLFGEWTEQDSTLGDVAGIFDCVLEGNCE